MDSLGRVLVDRTEELLQHWFAVVRGECLGRHGLSEAALRDSLGPQLQVIGEAIRSGMTESPEQLWTERSRLQPEERVLQRVPIEEVVTEYAYIVDVVRRWIEAHGIEVPFDEFSFFYSAVFHLTAESVRRYAIFQAQRVDELRETDRRTSEFLGVLSHELRNPLTPIRNSLYILERAAPGGEQARRAQEVIGRQVGHLARIVDDLLDVTRITHGKIRLQHTRLDFVEVVRRTLEDHRTLLEGRELSVELPKDAIWVEGDPTRLAQMIGNLLGNAAKFTPEGGKVSVSLSKTQGQAVLEVADTGLGIDPDTLKRLFEPFAQADRSLDRSKGGLGLGLALVKGIAGLHGGEVSAHSEGSGRGARFTIKLPLDERGTVTQVSPQPQVTNGTRRKVLIIEDNRDAAHSLSEALQLAGHEVAVAYDGDAGLAKAGAFRPEIILCDIGLPAGMDGYEVARALRRDDAVANAYLVALTGYAQPEDQQRAREAGFNAHMSKPPDLEVLRRLMEQALAYGKPADGVA